MVDKFKGILGDLYDPNTNPTGWCNVGVAENYVMTKVVASFINENVASSFHLTAKDFSYDTGPWGTDRLRNAMAHHINRLFKPHSPIHPSDLLFANGCTSLCEMLGFTICDPGDTILLSRPIYQAFKADFGLKAQVPCEFVSFNGADQFDLPGVSCYEEHIIKAQNEGKCYTPEAMVAFMKLCNKHGIHLVVDEIYAMSVYDVPTGPPSTSFNSILSFDTDAYINPNYLHLLYGMSKDMAAGGIRLGCLWTRNADLMRAMMVITNFHWSGNANEKIASLMLEDEKWMDWFLDLSRSTLAQANTLSQQLLSEHGIGFQEGSNAGLFLWVDLRKWCKKVDPTLKLGDDGFWAGEEALTKILASKKILLTNGKDMDAEEPGWYRFIFSQEEHVVREGIKRIVAAIKDAEAADLS
ncbi:MAG: hypothetical protein OHK93_001590 [Ramalina farinacea]|uniref:Aminotransferase class I/classII large domain-containing protein n=1 Tax=Ramalina farinacea TaxID=258253 RepID=A0AA43QT59_9LECA|nr:hypothetical protein [Ramalina farinacea]